MRVERAIVGGLRETCGTWRAVLFLLGLNLLLVTIPAGLVGHSIYLSLGASSASADLVAGYSDRWFSEYSALAQGLGQTFSPTVSGAGGVLKATDQFLDGGFLRTHPWIVGLGLVYWLFWVFLSAGILGTFGRRSAAGFQAFVGGCAEYFTRFLAIGAVVWVFLLSLYLVFLPAAGRFEESLTRDIVDERLHFALVVVKYGLVLLAFGGIRLLADYTKIALVIGHRRSLSGAFLEAAAFISGHACPVILLRVLLFLSGLILLGLGALLSFGSELSTWLGILGAFLVSQVWIVLRPGLRVFSLVSQAALYEGTDRPQIVDPTPTEGYATFA